MKPITQEPPTRTARAASKRQVPGARMSRVASGGKGQRRIRHNAMSTIASSAISNITKSMERPLAKNSAMFCPCTV